MRQIDAFRKLSVRRFPEPEQTGFWEQWGSTKKPYAYLVFVPSHKNGYNPALGIALLSRLLRGLLSAWYFDGESGARLEFTKLIPSASFLNFES